MQPTEIRYSKIKSLPNLVFLLIVSLGMAVYVNVSDKFANNNTFKVATVLMTAVMAYIIYRPARQILKNEPVLILSTSGIDINQNSKQFTFLWTQITEWKIEKIKNNWVLNLQTADAKKSISISWLEKDHVAIEELIWEYTKKLKSNPVD